MPEINNQSPTEQSPIYQKHLATKIWLPIVLGLAAMVIYLTLSNLYNIWPYQGRNDNSFTVTPVKHWQDQTATWQTYRNEEYGFEFKYPNDYILKEEEADRISLSDGITPICCLGCTRRIFIPKGDKVYILDLHGGNLACKETESECCFFGEKIFNQIFFTFKFIK